jgi:hypothetical protein
MTGLRSRKAMLETLVRELKMVRLSAGAFALAMAGCTGLIDAGSDGLTPEEVRARQLWTEKAAPVLNVACLGCHAGQQAGIDFLAGAGDMEKRETLLNFAPRVVNLEAPQSSRIITKGVHDGPALLATQTSDILDWIRAERDAQPSSDEEGPLLETPKFRPSICTAGTPPAETCPVNEVDLTPLGVPGARIHFVATALGSGLYLNQLSLIAGPQGAFIEHPLFVSHPEQGEPKPDMIDRFFNVKMNLMANETEQIAGGAHSFVNFVATDPISIHFRVIKPYQMEGGGPMGPTGGCKQLESFKTNALAMFAQNVGGAANACDNCHAGQDINATSALDITGIESGDDTMIQSACNQVLTRVNTTTPEQSSIFLAPDPANNNHPFRFNTAQINTFKGNAQTGPGVLKWIEDERTSP